MMEWVADGAKIEYGSEIKIKIEIKEESTSNPLIIIIFMWELHTGSRLIMKKVLKVGVFP